MPRPGKESRQVLVLDSPAVEQRDQENGAVLLWTRHSDGPVSQGMEEAAGPLGVYGGTAIPKGVYDAARVPAEAHGEEAVPLEGRGEGASLADHGVGAVGPVKESAALQGATRGQELAPGLDLRLVLGLELGKAVAAILQQVCGAQG